MLVVPGGAAGSRRGPRFTAPLPTTRNRQGRTAPSSSRTTYARCTWWGCWLAKGAAFHGPLAHEGSAARALESVWRLHPRPSKASCTHARTSGKVWRISPKRPKLLRGCVRKGRHGPSLRTVVASLSARRELARGEFPGWRRCPRTLWLSFICGGKGMEIRATSSLGTYPPGSFRAVLIPVPFRHRPHTKPHPRQVANKCIFAIGAY